MLLANLEDCKELKYLISNEFSSEEFKLYTCYFFRNLLFVSFRISGTKLMQLINKGENIKLLSINLQEYNLKLINKNTRCTTKLKCGNFDFEYDGTFLNIIFYFQNSTTTENIFPYIYENIIFPLSY